MLSHIIKYFLSNTNRLCDGVITFPTTLLDISLFSKSFTLDFNANSTLSAGLLLSTFKIYFVSDFEGVKEKNPVNEAE